VVSLAMLTECWDANTVTHILGIRLFRSQLLCEQVIGRGLRRRSYAVEEKTELLAPEYAEVYGVPFAFIPSDRPVPKPRIPRPPIEVRAELDRSELAIGFPKLDGYRVELPDERLHPAFTGDSTMHLDQATVALWVESQGLLGDSEQVDLDDIRGARTQRIAFAIAKTLAERKFAAHDGVERPWLFPQLVAICRQWLDEYVTTVPGVSKGNLLLAQEGADATEKIFDSIVRYPEARDAVLMPIVRPFDSQGSTNDVRFLTRKIVMDPPPAKSHLNHVVLDGARGNSWEEAIARQLERDDRVHSYVKNERLGFTIPYVHQGRSHEYVPDFLVRLATRSDDVERTLIVEVSGSMKSPGPTKAKAETARNQWCRAVNNWGEFGRWGYIEVHDPAREWHLLDTAIDDLYADTAITGLPA